MNMMRFDLQATDVAIDTAARTISGTIAVFGVRSTDGRYFDAGSLIPREPLRRVKFLLDHDLSKPIGYMQSFSQDAERARATMYLPPGAAGDMALEQAANGLRDGLSCGAYTSPDGYWFDDNREIHFKTLELAEVSQVSVPAFADTQVESVAAALAAYEERESSRMNQPRLEAVAPATEPPPPVMAAAVTAALPSAPLTLSAPPEVTAGPAVPTGLPAPHVATLDRPRSLHEVAEHVSAAIRSMDARRIVAALQDVLPADDVGKAWIGREDWLGELWRAAKTGRPWINSFGTPKPLNATKITGWQWNLRPKPAKYTGNKTDVPSNKPTTKVVTATPERWAGGWDIDRIFIDLGEPSFLSEFWAAAMEEYQAASDFDIAYKVVTGATVYAAGADVLATITGMASQLRSIGATLSQVWLDETGWAAYSSLTTAEVPFWLANSVGGVDLQNGTSSPGGLSINVDDRLNNGQVVGYDSRAVTVYERTPIQVQALDVAKGGLDLGFFSYGGMIVNDVRAVLTTAVTPPVGDEPEAEPATAKQSAKQ